MTTTAFQFVFNYATSIAIDTKPIVAQTISRDFTVRSVLRTNVKKRFTVKLPDGMPWALNRDAILALDSANKSTPGTIQLSATAYNTWFMPSDSTTYTVICTQMPQWTVFSRDQVMWSGPFTFIEY